MSDTGAATSEPSWLGWMPGGVTVGGNNTQRLLPDTTAFHADVQLGSLWKLEPERAGPMISQR